MSDDFLRKSDFAFAHKAVLSFEPAAFLINKGAKKLWRNHTITARCVSGLQYLTNPLDRMLQAAVTPFFAIASHIYVTHDTFSLKYQDGQAGKLGGFGYLAFRAVVLLPSVAGKSISIWIPLVVNTVVHLIPFKLISACRDKRPDDFFMRRQNTRRIPRKTLSAAFPSLCSSDKALAWDYHVFKCMKKPRRDFITRGKD